MKGGGHNADGASVSRRRAFRDPFPVVSLFAVPRERRPVHPVDDPSPEVALFRRRRADLLSVSFQERLRPRMSGAVSRMTNPRRNRGFFAQKMRGRSLSPSSIFTESFLSFLGLGVQAPMPSLGSLANSARGGLQSYPYKLVFPALMICLIVLSLNLIGDGLRDAFDPKLNK